MSGINDEDIVDVYSAADLAEAYFLRDVLADSGIQARVVGDALITGTGILPPGKETSPRLWVMRHDEARARKVLTEWEESRIHPQHDDAPAGPWTCPTCGERIEADFE